ncbi:hypothetical protein GWI33_021208 [Rhynchophorus ferrugineus]|uniref:Poly [ADP-ribose] polymerase n=1 Tax=Rhynchophorus ferrugineus TaxID=354439 RepID=A0A834HV30_RHYFE|nr:hypothetical protein GWI33_021208 [Rhynchophorus ferrugineus]
MATCNDLLKFSRSDLNDIPLKQKVIKNEDLFDLYKNGPHVVKYKTLDSQSAEYISVKNMIDFNIIKIDKILNEFNTMAFLLKKRFMYNDNYTIEMLHATKEGCVQGICENNFNWRLSGLSRGHKHGFGVNFTKSSYFANFFTNSRGSSIIIVADVLCKTTFCGHSQTRVPPKGYDTSIRIDEKVYVKFNDAEFNPKYVVYY